MKKRRGERRKNPSRLKFPSVYLVLNASKRNGFADGRRGLSDNPKLNVGVNSFFFSLTYEESSALGRY